MRAQRTDSKLYRQLTGDRRVWHVDGHESGCEDWLISLRPGWCSASDPMVPEHTIPADTLSEAMKLVRQAKPCQCEQCKRETAEERST